MSNFIVNLADLNKILEQIKIAERHVAGEALIDIIGQDAALLPMGLRTVDGTFNHLTGDTNAGAADQVFPRLLTPEYRNEGDETPFFGVSNTNYDPTIPGSHSVVDSDPRTISNLIVDQSANNPAAIAAARALAGDAGATQQQLLQAQALVTSTAAAALAAQAVETAMETAETNAFAAQAAVAAAIAKLNQLAIELASGPVTADQIALVNNAVIDAQTAVTEAQNTVNLLLATTGASGADTAAASTFLLQAQALHAAVTQVAADVASPGSTPGIPFFTGAETTFLNNVTTNVAPATSTAATTFFTAMSTSENAAEAASSTADLNSSAAQLALSILNSVPALDQQGDGSLNIEHRSADIGLSPANSGWMTLFGQFFDHGLDLVAKGGNGTVFIPLLPDDPLYVPGAQTNFMALTRATPAAAGQTESVNTTTPFVDQNQTYTSNASHQAFLRAYKSVDGVTVNTGELLDGAQGGIPTWFEVKTQAKDFLGLTLNDQNVLNVPMLVVDPYGKIVTGAHGFAQVAVTVTLSDSTTVNTYIEGRAGGLDLGALTAADVPPAAIPPGLTVSSVSTIGTGHAFLDDIAHNAAPKAGLVEDSNTTAGSSLGPQDPGTYDDELLDSHYITGDGRGNENIGLTTVHFIFHNEHNRIVEENKKTILASGDLATINEWLATDLTDLNDLPPPGDPAALAIYAATLDWDGERMFQAARFTTEMQYQHLVFEEFARRMQPNVDPFIFTNSADLDPAIVAEFAHVVYRFGHSMLDDTIDRFDSDLSTVNGDADQIGLLEAFLNPQAFDASGATDTDSASAVILGMTRQVGQEIDEFVINTLRNNLVGLPLDLPVLNIARAREQGIPSLNHAREQLYAASGHADVRPYTSWIDFAQHLKHPESIINFIAAYGTHQTILDETTLAGKRAAALELVMGVDADNNPTAITDRIAFLNATGSYASGDLGGLNLVDMWVGGLAEEINEFGGQLGSTFNFVFEYQMEHLQNGDRFYYLSRTQGMNLLNQLEGNTFADIIMRNTNLSDLHATHMSAEVMEVPDMILELDSLVAQENYSGDPLLDGTNPADRSQLDPTHDNAFRQAIDPKVLRINGTIDVDGDGFADGNVLKFSGGEHVVLGGTEGNDSLYGDKGIDTLWGDGGDDYLNPGMESDQVFGGDGDDIIEDPFGDDFLRGEAGNDVVVNGAGLDILFGGTGNDFIMAVTDTTEVFAGEGNDFILGGTAPDVLLGNEGDDWIEGGEGFDGLSGENSELFFNSPIIGHDILNGQGNDTDYDGENGDDIMVQSAGIQRNNGMDGFDWAIHKGDAEAADSDLGIRVFDARPALILRDRFDSVEGLSGWQNDDILTGAAKLLIGEGFSDALTQAGVDRIAGLRTVIGAAPGLPTDVVLDPDTNLGGEILLGGAGSDTIRGNLGDDIIDGDAWLNVRIAVMENKDGTGAELFSVDSLNDVQARLRSGEINPGQLKAVREILYDDAATVAAGNPVDTSEDVAVFSDIRDNYTITRNPDGTWTVNHTGFTVPTPTVPDSDGIDTLRNIEIARFANANGIGNDDLLLVNRAATGAPVLSDTSPTETQQLTAITAGIADANGIASGFSFQWQSALNVAGVPGAFTNIGGAVNATFTPGAATVGRFLQVVVSFTDGLGNLETVTSAPSTRIVGDSLIANTATINGTAGDDILTGGNIANTINGLAGDDRITAGTNNDIINGGNDNDTIIWSGANPDGRDFVNGGSESLPGIGDTFVINGSNVAEVYRVYSLAAAQLAGLNGFSAGTEIVITRNTNGVGGAVTNANIIAGLDEIEEIVINATTVSTPANGPVGGNTNIPIGADTVRIIGNFNGTDLNFNTITINGGSGDDTVDVSQLLSDHHVVLNTGGGTDTLIGQRSQDELNVTAEDADDDIDNGDGNDDDDIDDNSGNDDDDIDDDNSGNDDDNDDDDDVDNDDNDDDADDSDDDSNDEDDDEVGQNTGGTVSPYVVYIGTGASDTYVGGASHDTLAGEGGDDTLFGLDGNDNLAGGAGADHLIAGAGDDVIVGNDGSDTILAGSGNDTILAGAGDDTVFADDGDDLIFANEGHDVVNAGNGNDTIYAAVGDGSDALHGGDGTDTIDLEAITANLVVDLGSNGVGSSNSTQSGFDTLSGIENVVGGSGNDTIYASNSVNVLDGGAGNDSFVFKTAAAANGDSIVGFQTGDTIDLDQLYASLGVSNTTVIENNANFSATGQVHLRVVGENTVIEGNTDIDNDVDFSITVVGRTNLNASDLA